MDLDKQIHLDPFGCGTEFSVYQPWPSLAKGWNGPETPSRTHFHWQHKDRQGPTDLLLHTSPDYLGVTKNP